MAHAPRKISASVALAFVGLTALASPPGTWTQLSPTHKPSARSAYGMAYDSTKGAVVLFGGETGSSTQSDETWSFDGSDWTQHSISTRPSTRMLSGMAFDANRGVTVLFGGLNGSSDLSDTWELAWNSGMSTYSWSQISISGPSVRRGATMGYDPNRHVVVLFGGYHSGTVYDDTYEYDGSSWTAISIASNDRPGARYDSRMVWDSTSSQLVLVCGSTYVCSPGVFYNLRDTWRYVPASGGNPARWEEIAEDGPGGRTGPGVVYLGDGYQRRVCMIGGANGKATWLMEPSGNWTAYNNLGSSGPGEPYDVQLVRFGTGNNYYLFGGKSTSCSSSSYSQDTWRFNPGQIYGTTDCPADADNNGMLDVNDYIIFGNLSVSGCPLP